MKRIGLFFLVIALLFTACSTPAPLLAEYPTQTTTELTATADEFALPGLPSLPSDRQVDNLYTAAQAHDILTTTALHTTITTLSAAITQTQTTIAPLVTATLPTVTTRAATIASAPTRPTGVGNPSGGSAGSATHTHVTIPVTRAGLIAMGGAVTLTSHMEDSIGRESTRNYTGVPLRNVLAVHGVNVSTAPANSTVLVTAHDGTTFTLNRSQFTANTTLLAWVEDRGAGDVRQLDRPRLVFPQGLSGTFIQHVVTIQFNP